MVFVRKIKSWLRPYAPECVRHAVNGLRRVMEKPNPYIDQQHNPLCGYRCYDGIVETLIPITGHTGKALSQNLIQEKGDVEVNGQVYDMNQPGIYRFYRLPSLSEQRIVATENPEDNLRSIGYLWKYGNKDDPTSTHTLLECLKKRTVVASCGKLALLTKALCDEMQIKCRLVCTLSLCAWGGEDDGHTMVEIQDENKAWFLYDPSFNLCFVKNGKKINLIEFSSSFMKDVYFYNMPGNGSTGDFYKKGYFYDFWLDERLLGKNQLTEWYQRIKPLPFIHDGEKFQGFLKEDHIGEKKRVKTLYQIISRESFYKKFYNHQHDL